MSTTNGFFENSVPGLPRAAAAEDVTPLEYMRRYGSFEVRRKVGALYEESVPAEELDDALRDAFDRVYTKTPNPPSPNVVPVPTIAPDDDGRRFAGVIVDGELNEVFPRQVAALSASLATGRPLGVGKPRLSSPSTITPAKRRPSSSGAIVGTGTTFGEGGFGVFV